MSNYNREYNGANNFHGFSPYPSQNGYQQIQRNTFARDVRSGNSGNWTAQKRKHSGARFKTDVNKNPCITAWNYSRRLGLVSIFIAPYKGSYDSSLLGGSKMKVHVSKHNKEYYVWMCKITGKGIDQHFPVFVSTDMTKAYIRTYGWLVKTTSPNGGYCGKFKPSK